MNSWQEEEVLPELHLLSSNDIDLLLIIRQDKNGRMNKGQKIMMFNARQICRKDIANKLILVAIEARILTVADVVEAMASHRPYRPGLGINAALDEIKTNRTTLFDGEVVDACMKLFREKDKVSLDRRHFSRWLPAKALR